jgi:3-deoxy-7-phosphoheptulonate synthase
MMVVMPLDAPGEDIEKVKEKARSLGLEPRVIVGVERIAVALTGPTERIEEKEFYSLNSVIDVVRISKKYKLASRDVKKEDTVIRIGDEEIGGSNFTVIAGPCSIESRESILEVAAILKELGIKFLRGGAYKPRSSPYAFQGLKEKGLEYLKEAKEKYGIYIVTEAIDTINLNLVAEVADIIQIGARNMQNYALLQEVGKLDKPILLKRSFAASIEELLLSAEYILAGGNDKVILCERGIRTFETYTRNTLDLNAVPAIKKLSHLPIIVDPSHGIGIRELVPNMALAAMACGSDGVIIEAHKTPEKALSDGHQTINIETLKKLIEKFKMMESVVNKRVNIELENLCPA